MRYRYIDIVRGFAALSILIWHYQHFYFPAPGVWPALGFRSSLPFYDWLWPFYHQGGLAVQLFWVVSGFVFAATYLAKPVSGWTYFVNRLARLYPLHFATLLIVAILQFASLRMVGHFQIYQHNDAYHFVLNLFVVQGWGFESGFSFNAPSWSVSVEVAIYVLFFLSLPILRRSPIAVAIACTALSILLLTAGVKYRFGSCALFFYLGVVGFAVVDRSPRAALGVGAAAIAGFAAFRWFRDGKLTLSEMSLLFSGIILIAAAVDVLRPLRSGALDWFGNATYGTYLVHVPIQMALLIALQFYGLDRAAFASHGASLLLFLVLVFATGIGAYKYFELPWKQTVKSALLRRGDARSPVALAH